MRCPYFLRLPSKINTENIILLLLTLYETLTLPLPPPPNVMEKHILISREQKFYLYCATNMLKSVFSMTLCLY